MRCIYHGGAASRKLEANIYRAQLRQVALARSLAKAGKEARQGGKGQVNRKGSRGRRVRVRTKGWYSYFPSDKANNRFLGILRRCRIVHHCGPPQKEGMREEEENESESNRRISSVPRRFSCRSPLRSALRKVLA